MRADFRRDMNDTYLILSDDNEIDQASYPVRIVTDHKLDGLLVCKLQQMNQRQLFYYEITGKQSLKEWLSYRPLQQDTLTALLLALQRVHESLNNYLLGIDSLVLDPALIYYQASANAFFFCYLPGSKLGYQEQIKVLSEYILTRLDHKDPKAVVICYDFYQAAVDGMLTDEKIKTLLRQGSEEVKKKDSEEEKRQAYRVKQVTDEREKLLDDLFLEDRPELEKKRLAIIQNVKGKWILGFAAVLIACAACTIVTGYIVLGILIAIVISVVFGIVIYIRLKKKEQLETDQEMEKYIAKEWDSRPVFEEEEDLSLLENEPVSRMKTPRQMQSYEGGDETICLQMDTEPVIHSSGPRLQPLDSVLDTVLLTGDQILVGKDHRISDLVLPSKAVSRLHARIMFNGKERTIVDLNSRNGTFVNRHMLEQGEQHILKEGDEITFGDLTYQYHQ